MIKLGFVLLLVLSLSGCYSIRRASCHFRLDKEDCIRQWNMDEALMKASKAITACHHDVEIMRSECLKYGCTVKDACE